MGQDAREIEEWSVVVQSEDGLYGAGRLRLGNGRVVIEAPAVDEARLRRSQRVRSALFLVAVAIALGVVVRPDIAPALIALAIAVAVIGVVYAEPRWYTGAPQARRFDIDDLSDAGLGEASENALFTFLLFGWVGLALGSLVPRYWLRFSIDDDERGLSEYLVDLGSAEQYVRVAAKVREMERDDARSLL